MQLSGNKLLLFINRIILLAIYVSFFVVQTVNNSIADYTTRSNISLTSFKDGVGIKVFSSNKAKDYLKSNIRLNKRFHPESIIGVSYSLAQPVLLLSATIIKSKPQDYLLISSIIRDSLRGPPVVS